MNSCSLFYALVVPALGEVKWDKDSGKTVVLVIRPGAGARRKLEQVGFSIAADQAAVIVMEPWRACALATDAASARWPMLPVYGNSERVLLIIGDRSFRMVITRDSAGGIETYRTSGSGVI